MNQRLTADQWSDFWQAGSVTTFMGRFEQNYDGVVRHFWRKLFAVLPANAQIVDLATGNGALALLALEFSDEYDRNFNITGVDFAATDPRATLKGRELEAALERIHFLTSTRIEATGLPDGEFDLVCSQFGFEYADIADAVVETARLLKDDKAVFAAMLHHESSVVLQQAKEGVRQDVQCRKSGLLAKVKELLFATAKAGERGIDPKQCEDCEALRHDINHITGKLHNAQSQYRDPGQLAYYVGSIMSVFDPQRADQSIDEKLQHLDTIDEECQLFVARMRDLLGSALTDDDIAGLCARFEDAGLSVDFSESIEMEGQLFCHALVVVR
ncbi:MAG: class I SAM-dependent methyltransferase [Pseudomonadota bacterium]